MAKRIIRGAGVVMPVSSLPGRYGIGDFSAAEQWLTWLHSAGQTYWQILPLLIPDSVGSPFSSPSGFAIDPLLGSPAWLQAEGLVTTADLRRLHHAGRIHRSTLIPAKQRLWRTAWMNWQRVASDTSRVDFQRWRKIHALWLEPYIAYQAIKDSYGGRPWWKWAPRWRDGRQAMKKLTPALQADADFHAWCQWVLDRQWQRVRLAARRHHITIVGDLPFYVQYDSVEVWTRPELFLLDAKRAMKVVSGYRPDIFSHLGQKWGTPVYRWSAHRREHWAWWTGRIAAELRLYDLIRLDHFVGLQSTWHVPIRAKTGVTGQWATTPGAEILKAIRRRVGGLPFVAEDLGRVGTAVNQLRADFHIPGSRVLQFAWSGLSNNLHDPKFVEADVAFYTANHDTNTTIGWLKHEAKWYEKLHLSEHYGNLRDLNWKFISTVYQHRAIIALVHIADVFGYGREARINHPGTSHRNWSWRLERWPSAAVAKKLHRLSTQSRRFRRGR